jgi:glycosyltransferase involved in cell wall biosynthesis
MTSKVVVLDDFFPHLETGFRIAEFTWLLRRGVVDRVLTTASLETAMPSFRELYPELADQVQPYQPAALTEAKLAWIEFLNNATLFLDDLEAAGVPFVLTVYPGGGLNLGVREAAKRLRRVLESELLRAVVTTQPLVTAWVRREAPMVDVLELPGVPVGSAYFRPGAGFRTDYYGEPDVDELRICFVAYRYVPGGGDKGYDLFLDTVRWLAARGVPVSAHVVGGFGPDDLPIGDIADRLTFHGPLETARLHLFFTDQHLVISPTRADVLAAGSFDGVPTGAAVEGALCGVGIVTTDPRGQNTLFRDGRDILIVPPDAEAIADRVQSLTSAPGGIRRLAQAGLATARRSYGVSAQLVPRRRLIERLTEDLGEGVDSIARQEAR